MTVLVGFGRAMALACALAAGSTPAARPSPSDQCQLALTSRYVGARAIPAVRSAVTALARPHAIRWIAPGQAIATDYSPQRLNVILDETGRIMAMRCG